MDYPPEVHDILLFDQISNACALHRILLIFIKAIYVAANLSSV